MNLDPFTRARPAAAPARDGMAFDFPAYLAAANLPADTAPPAVVPLGRNDTLPRA